MPDRLLLFPRRAHMEMHQRCYRREDYQSEWSRGPTCRKLCTEWHQVPFSSINRRAGWIGSGGGYRAMMGSCSYTVQAVRSRSDRPCPLACADCPDVNLVATTPGAFSRRTSLHSPRQSIAVTVGSKVSTVATSICRPTSHTLHVPSSG